MPYRHSTPFEDFRPAPQQRLSALWVSLMFCYSYGDYFGLYLPGKLMAMNAGRMGPLGVLTPAKLVAVSLMMAIPGLMVAMSLLLPPTINRWLNLVLGAAYSAIMLLTLIGGAPPYYLVLAVVEIALCIGIMLTAWTWPRKARAA
jgi:hypothetical protein